ncbi:MAG: hypothetical protein V1768_01180 [Patescibacteria group bacterium]|nr:hypothetical protein [Patescibacteria group bacterium]MBU1160551.1 hypothetical protein [Patescibacteria group bacterium]MBU1684450.1 hypothetical protein [Patescibacteria group bacterium]MBU1778578.1 hypothetical protein [Patescibacteria group bacterium]MBU1987558.1 hypothetical protein [Patescibacteria group bacterium]
MRQVLSISLPSETIQSIKTKVMQRGFNSVSSYIKHLLFEDNNLISEQELIRSVKQACYDYEHGKTIKAKSLANLL